MIYKTLSILQPWGSLVCLGHKLFETRSWNTRYRGPLLIHASAGKRKDCREINMDFQQQFYHLQLTQYEYLPFGAIIGQVTLVDTFPIEEAKRRIAYLQEFGKLNQEQELAFGDYSPGRYGWLLSNPVLFPVTIPAKGSLGLWEFDMPEKVSCYLSGGAHASFDGMPDTETLEAVEAMVQRARVTVRKRRKVLSN